MRFYERIDRGTGKRYQLGAASDGWILDRRRRMADALKESIDFIIAERRALLVGFELGCE